MDKKILIVDDEQDMRDLYEDYLVSVLGYSNITFAVDGIDAFMKCSFTKFDTIVLDIKMPRLNGGEFLIALREKEGLNQNTPVIVVSAFINETNEELKPINHTMFLPKPFNLEFLGRCINLLNQNI